MSITTVCFVLLPFSLITAEVRNNPDQNIKPRIPLEGNWWIQHGINTEDSHSDTNKYC